jgi:adenosine deaminase
MTSKQLPKAILHEHIEGSVTPRVAKTLADIHGINLPEDFFYRLGEYDEKDFPNGRYKYDESDFNAFINTYDQVASLVKEPEDYYLVVKDFLTRNAEQGMIYCEIITSAFHLCFDSESGKLDAERYRAIMEKIEQAIDEVQRQYGSITRLHACGVRHLGEKELNMSLDFMKEHPRAMLTGMNIAGNEMAGTFSSLAKVHETAEALGLRKSYHAGEICGVESIKNALKHGAVRIGHGIRAIDDECTIDSLIRDRITLEISPTSNRILVPEMKQSLDEHPLRKLYDKGVRLSINTDDAGLFGTDIEKEYQIASEQFGFSRVELFDVTICAIEAAFVDDETKQNLLEVVYNMFTYQDLEELEKLCDSLAVGPLQSRLLGRLRVLNNTGSKNE